MSESQEREREREAGQWADHPPHPTHCHPSTGLQTHWPASDWGALVSKHNPSLIISVCKEVVLGGRGGGSVAGGAGTHSHGPETQGSDSGSIAPTVTQIMVGIQANRTM